MKEVGGTTTEYCVDDRNPSGYAQVMDEYMGAWIRSYDYGLGLVTEESPQTGGTVYYGMDGHGSVRFLAQNDGVITDAYWYDAYGTIISRSGTNQNNYLYCAQQFDPDLGLYYNRARYLDTDTGRFWSSDSMEGNNKDPLSLHKYLYCDDDPINDRDLDGHDALGDLITIGSGFLDLSGGLNNFVSALRELKLTVPPRRLEADRVRYSVIRPILNDIEEASGVKLSGDAAEELLLGTAIQESGLRARQQKNNDGSFGPALGIFQMEPDTHDDIWDNSLHGKLKSSILTHFHLEKPNLELLKTDDEYAAIMARIAYRRAPGKLPPAGDLQGQATYWKTYYNTYGKGTVPEYIENWNAFMKL